jgi:hypothetical protein
MLELVVDLHQIPKYSSRVHAQAVELRLAELVAALSVATDLGGGQPIGHSRDASYRRQLNMMFSRLRSFSRARTRNVQRSRFSAGFSQQSARQTARGDQ